MRQAHAKAYAKINLGLKILGRRADGFHELRTVFQAISLCDSIDLQISSSPAKPRITLSVEGLDVPSGADNLVVRAARAIHKELGGKQSISIHLKKRIPTGAGLGGGSSDAAAVLRILDGLSSQKLSRMSLLRIAVELGSDVPYFLFGGRAIGVGRGEEVYPLPDGPSRYCLLVLPHEGMNTAEAYRLLSAKPWPPNRDRATGKPGKLTGVQPHPTIDLFCASLLSEVGSNNNRPVETIRNDFQPVVFARFPQLATATKVMLKCGAEWAALTGSGSAVYGLFADKAQAHTAFQELQSPQVRLLLCRTIRRLQCERGLRMV
jgi:4-diphosphocytidyl-2-C-methyl-D-erythritol kinase